MSILKFFMQSLVAHILHEPYSTLLIDERQPADVPRHDLVRVRFEIASLPQKFLILVLETIRRDARHFTVLSVKIKESQELRIKSVLCYAT